MFRIGGPYERTPNDGSEIVLAHYAANTFGVDLDATTVQFPHDATVAVTREFSMNVVDLETQFLILGFTPLPVRSVRLVVVAAGRQAGHLARFRN